MSRRSRAVRRGTIQAARHERRRRAQSDLPSEIKLMLVAIAALLVLGAMLLGAGDDSSTTDARTTAGSVATSASVQAPAQPSESECVRLRRDWHEVSLVDFDLSQQIKADYQSLGCESVCWGLVEDTDTPEPETRCEYP